MNPLPAFNQSSERVPGARDVVRGIDARVRRFLDGRVPRLPESWSQRVPEVADPELRRYLIELAAAMDDRVRRLGERAVQTRPGWVVDALGDVPEDLAMRAVWESRAAQLSAYRELYGYDSKTAAMDPNPVRPPRKSGPTGTPRSRPLAGLRASACAVAATTSCDFGAGCTNGKPAGRRHMSSKNSG